MRYNATYRAMNMHRELRGDMDAYGKMPPSLTCPFPSLVRIKGIPDAFCGTELIPNIWYTNLASLKEINFSRVIQLKDF